MTLFRANSIGSCGPTPLSPVKKPLQTDLSDPGPNRLPSRPGYFLHPFYRSTDGTLFPSYTLYRGCTYFCEECASIQFQVLIDNVKGRILYELKDPQKILLGREIRVKVECPSHRFPEEIPKPKVELLTLSLKVTDPDRVNPFNRIFGVEQELKAFGLDLDVKKIHFHSIDLDRIDSFYFRSPKLPSDTEARIGVRKDPRHPDRIEKVFGYNAVLTTFAEPLLGMELPVAGLTIAGNAEEGNQFMVTLGGRSQCQNANNGFSLFFNPVRRIPAT